MNYQDRFSFLHADIHSHILPDIDDGSPDTETSLVLLNGLIELGFKTIVTTPHVLSDLYPNTAETIFTAGNSLMSNKEFPLNENNFKLAAEFMVDYEFEEKLENSTLLSFGVDKNILIEMSYLVESQNIRQVIFKLLTMGFQPILAHPERYGFYHHRLDAYESLVDAGCQMQLNLLSLAGHYGKPVQAVSEKLIKKGLYHWIGTDMHHTTHLSMLQEMASNDKFLKKLEEIKDLKNQSLTFI